MLLFTAAFWSLGMLPPFSVWLRLDQLLASAFSVGAVAEPGWIGASVSAVTAIVVSMLLPRLRPILGFWVALGIALGITATGALIATGTGQFPTLSCAAAIALGAWVFGFLSNHWLETGPSTEESARTEARRMAAQGMLVEAWTQYQALEMDRTLLPELYQLGLSAERESPGLAKMVFSRVATIDADFKDVREKLGTHHPHHQTSALQKPGAEPRTPVRLDSPATVRLGRYEVLKEIGRGAMGVVYMGRDPKINRIVAIKAIPLAEEFDPEYLEEARERFFREAETAGRLNHTDIVTIFDVGEDAELAFIAMEYLKGQHLSDFTEPRNLLEPGLALEIAARTADALHYAHRQNVVHRDIKPANIMYDFGSDSLKITDFGIARLTDASRTRTGIVLGTPSFMSPEQLEGKNVNGNTDLFALGVTLYQLLTGQLPFRGASMTKLMFVIANEPHQPVSELNPVLPKTLDRFFDLALAKGLEDRFESGATMSRAIRACARELTATPAA